jgi:broad specificity phosphatase PhoE
MPPHAVWLLRHAETAWSRDRKHTGRTDVPLTDDGRRHALALRERLAGRRFALVLSSPLSRAWETAQLAGLGDLAQPRDELLEWDYGDYEGRTTKEIRAARPGWYLWRDGCPGGEGPADVQGRCDRLLDDVMRGEGDVALSAHGHILRALSARWLEEPVAFGGRIALDTGAVCVLGWEREVRVIRRWNEVPAAAG